MVAHVLAVIDSRRDETGDPRLGASIEKEILDHELRELEENTAKHFGGSER